MIFVFYNNIEYQTKDIECSLNKYEIKDNLLLLDSKSYNFTGIVNIYNYDLEEPSLFLNLRKGVLIGIGHNQNDVEFFESFRCLESPSKTERIISSAILFKDEKIYAYQPINISSGFVVTGYRHSNIYTTMAILCPDLSYKKIKRLEGFLTDKNRFITRDEAYDLATENGQFIADGRLYKQLYSEDLW